MPLELVGIACPAPWSAAQAAAYPIGEQGSLRQNDEFRVAAGLTAEAVIGHDQRRAGSEQLADALDRLGRQVDALERFVGARRRLGVGERRRLLDLLATPLAANLDWAGRMFGRHRN